MPRNQVVDYARPGMPRRRSMWSMCGQHLVTGFSRTVSSKLPTQFKLSPGGVSGHALATPPPPGVRICAPVKARC